MSFSSRPPEKLRWSAEEFFPAAEEFVYVHLRKKEMEREAVWKKMTPLSLLFPPAAPHIISLLTISYFTVLGWLSPLIRWKLTGPFWIILKPSLQVLQLYWWNWIWNPDQLWFLLSGSHSCEAQYRHGESIHRLLPTPWLPWDSADATTHNPEVHSFIKHPWSIRHHLNNVLMNCLMT